MANKKTVSTAAKEQVNKVLSQAKESLKILEVARTFVKLPSNPKELTNEKILASLKKLGVATQEEVQSLRARVEELEATVANQSARSSDRVINDTLV
ncbi:MAG: hypothetical protein A2X94_06190 [Bdellovibrionales bacterium GWB1_55_8]|nr:MAG: hypothetical protein A2X94_06190 [Bdellovibrionales bacterium GWB1_55_8]